MEESRLFDEIIKALFTDYLSVYYVNVKTGEYHWFSEDKEFHSLNQKQSGTNFFEYMKNEVIKAVHEEDRHVFTVDLQKENLLKAAESGDVQNFKFRLMADDRPVYYSIRVIKQSSNSKGDVFFIFGVRNIDREERKRQAIQRSEKEKEEFNNIAKSLAEDYLSIYYINIETGRYTEFSSSDEYESMNVPKHWDDFYKDTRDNVRLFVHPDDREFAISLYYKEKMLEKLKDKKSFSYKYRIMIKGDARYFSFTVIRADDGEHLVLCVKDINDEITTETMRLEKQKKHITYSQIAESLASNYDVIYYVDTDDTSYVGYTTNDTYGQFEVKNEGQAFFRETKNILSFIIHPQDRKKITDILDKDYLLSVLEEKKRFSIDFRMIIENDPQYTRLTVSKSSDKKHLIIGVENINDEINREKEHIKALSLEKELARRDELTGIKNKTAYAELEKTTQSNIDSGKENLPFAIAVCDINWLKKINDSKGHKAGDEYIKAASKLLCDIFAHSPVFRIGGDEFVVFLGGSDYSEREELIKKLREQVHENMLKGRGPVIAVGIADFDPDKDSKVSDVFERADSMMYEDKRRLKE